MSAAVKATLREVYQEGGSHDYQSLQHLLGAALIRWDGASQLYRTTAAGRAALRGES